MMSISDGSDRTFFCPKMGKTRSVREEMDGRVFLSRQSRHPFLLINNMIIVLFPICTLIWRVNIYDFPPMKGINRRKKSTIMIVKLQPLSIVSLFKNHF